MIKLIFFSRLCSLFVNYPCLPLGVAKDLTFCSQMPHIFSIKHDLARSCFQLWPKIDDEGKKISRKKNGEALAETGLFEFFFSF